MDVDVNEYDTNWEISVREAAARLYGSEQPSGSTATLPWSQPPGSAINSRSNHDQPNLPQLSPNTKVIDIRPSKDFLIGHLPGSINTPLADLLSTSGSPYDNVDVLRQQWNNLKALSEQDAFRLTLGDEAEQVYFVCYNGETSRLATALLRGQGVKAHSIRGGVDALCAC